MTTVALDKARGALRPCRHCGGRAGVLTPPAGPHHAGVRCARCDRHLGWLPKPPPPDDEDPAVIDD